MKPGCAWCSSGDLCGVDAGRPVCDCPVAKVERSEEPSNADIVRLLSALMTGVNQRFAQIMLLINHHMHKPEDRK